MSIDKIKNCVEIVHKQLGFGLSEKAYQKALRSELEYVFKDVQSEFNVHQTYTTSQGNVIQLAVLRIDLYLDNNIVLELKTLPGRLSGKTFLQCRRYMRLVNSKEGYAINFGKNDYEIIPVSYSDTI